jgi:hypothetical protein
MNRKWKPLLNILLIACLFVPLGAGLARPAIEPHVASSFSHTVSLPLVVHGYESPYLEKTAATPDYQQTDPAYGGFPGQGSQYCAPVAASNSLIWLDDHGYDRLVPSSADRKFDQFSLITWLGSSSYMDTSLQDGTGINDFLKGVKKYIQDQDYQYTRLHYQGWRYHASEFDSGVEIPDLNWIKQGTVGLNSAWINFGRYTYDPASDVYTRFGGHYITVVGYGFDHHFSPPLYFIVHDPARGSVADITNHPLSLELISSGTLRGDYTGLPRSAAGYYRLTFQPPLPSDRAAPGAQSAETVYILDGAVVLQMPADPTALRNTPADLSNSELSEVQRTPEGD